MAGFGGAVKLTGESEYRKALQQITQNLKEVSSEMKVVSTAYDSNDKSIQALSAKEEVLNKTLSEQNNKLSTLKSAYESMSSKFQDQATKHQALVNSYVECLIEVSSTICYQTQTEVVDRILEGFEE